MVSADCQWFFFSSFVVIACVCAPKHFCRLCTYAHLLLHGDYCMLEPACESVQCDDCSGSQFESSLSELLGGCCELLGLGAERDDVQHVTNFLSFSSS